MLKMNDVLCEILKNCIIYMPLYKFKLGRENLLFNPYILLGSAIGINRSKHLSNLLCYSYNDWDKNVIYTNKDE